MAVSAMIQTMQAQYWYDRRQEMELICCKNSALSYPLHNHVSVFTAGLVLQGSILLTVENRTILCQAGHSFLILPYAPHAIQASAPYSLLTFCINKNEERHSDWNRLLREIQTILAAMPDLQLTTAQAAQFANCLESLRSYANSQAYATPFSDIKNQLEQHPERQLRLEELACAAHISKYHFIRSFKQTVGLTPHQFQIQNRIRKAQRLIPIAATLTEVALTTGFCDQSHFIKQFEKYVGLTPTAYKRACRRFSPECAD